MTYAPSARALHVRSRSATLDHTRIFLAVEVPAQAAPFLKKSLDPYVADTKHIIPAAQWHVTLAFLGELPNVDHFLPDLTAALPQEYVSTVSVTHVGRGKRPDQLWAYIHSTPALGRVRAQILGRLQTLGLTVDTKDFIPHISLATLEAGSKIADTPCSLTFPFHTVHIYRSHSATTDMKYESIGTIALTS